MIYQTPWFWAVVALLLVGILIATRQAGESSAPAGQKQVSGDLQSDMTAYLVENPGFQNTFARLEPILERQGDAVERMSVTGVLSACEEMETWTVQISRYDPPLPLFKPMVEDFQNAAAACLSGDFDTAGESIGDGGDKAARMGEQLSNAN